MPVINEFFLDLPENYLFSDIAKRVKEYKEENPEADIIRLGIGDVTLPLPKVAIDAMHKAVDEMANADTFRGYGPEQGYEFLRQAIAEDYKRRGVNLDIDEIFISDGSKSDLGNFTDLLDRDNRIAIIDPVYPVYIDSNVMFGRCGKFLENGKWSNLIYIPCTADNDFIPDFPSEVPDVVYLCYPNNPTGTVLTKDQLAKWVDYALEHNVLILFDSAYEAFISEDNIPHSIYEIEGADKVAVEFRSFSKTAGFTGVRCGYTVVPKKLNFKGKNGVEGNLNRMWCRRQTTKFNGTAYIVQRAAEATLTDEGRRETKELVNYYMNNVSLLRKSLQGIGLEVYGGCNAPYIWIRVPKGETSWSFFERMLKEKHIVSTPGVGFGPSGEGYLRITGFGKYEDTLRVIDRLKNWKL